MEPSRVVQADPEPKPSPTSNPSHYRFAPDGITLMPPGPSATLPQVKHPGTGSSLQLELLSWPLYKRYSWNRQQVGEGLGWQISWGTPPFIEAKGSTGLSQQTSPKRNGRLYLFHCESGAPLTPLPRRFLPFLLVHRPPPQQIT